MSFASAVAIFAAQAARERREAFPTRITTAEATPRTLSVFLSPWRVERELGDSGPIETVRAQLRVELTAGWSPAVGDEFTLAASEEVARINARTSHPSAAELVYEVVRISP